MPGQQAASAVRFANRARIDGHAQRGPRGRYPLARRRTSTHPARIQHAPSSRARKAVMAEPQAVLKTNRGDITVNLFPNHAPETVANFTGLATGEKSYDAGNGRTGPFYDGLTFHRVIDGFMIQGGCPLGTGTG